MKAAVQSELPMLKGERLASLPEDLFIPPNALELFLEDFSGPMDVLLYLIRKKDINILALDVSEITDQYIKYIELMDTLKIELASDYLVMAATLAHIKSRMMLPLPKEEEDEADPRSELIKRLQEYQRYKTASEELANLPRIERDFFATLAGLPSFKQYEEPFTISVLDLQKAFIEANSRPKYKSEHTIEFEELSTQERIALILEILSKRNIVQFYKVLKKSEGRQGVAVSLLASLELAKDGKVEIIQNEDSNHMYLKTIREAIA
ncbi:MAG: ScpA family protein [Gammaproteobacteria bacterium]